MIDEQTVPTVTQAERRDEVRRLLKEYAAHHDPDVREQLVDLNRDLVKFIARRFASRGEPLEDIEQVGYLGLIYAIERFDPNRELEFSTFATPTITGEIRRYFRDRSWSVRVPRRLQENYQRVSRIEQVLKTYLERSPTVPELADELGIDPDDVLAALEIAPAQHAISLATSPQHETEGSESSLEDFLGKEDLNLDRVEIQDVLDRALSHLTPRERRILALRFIDQLSQAEVAEQLGISQMHVSRLQRAALDELKRQMNESDVEF